MLLFPNLSVVDSCLVMESGGGLVRSNVCGEHGECLSENNYGGFTCICDPGFSGKYCQLSEWTFKYKQFLR